MSNIALVEKVYKTNSFFVERTLPDVGQIFSRKGDAVQPFTRIGETKISYFFQRIGPEYALTKDVNTYIEKGVQIGECKKGFLRVEKIYAPYNGFIRPVGDGSYVFEQEKENFHLLSGVWGEVTDIVETKSVLIKGRAMVIYGAVSTPFDCEGELIVLPNPSELLEDPYFTNFTKDIAGKVIYSGYFVKLENLKKAIEMRVRGIVAGGFDRTTYDYAVKEGFSLVSFSGYGRIPTPTPIFDLLSTVSNRYVFIRGQKQQVFIPSEQPFGEEGSSRSKRNFFVQVKSGMMVQILERPYFGWMGTVESATPQRANVRLEDGGEIVNVRSTNLMALTF